MLVELTLALPQMDHQPHPSDPDERMQQAARAALLARGYRTVAAIECNVVNGEVTLTGEVESYFLKQIAQEAVLQLDAIRSVHNAIRVRSRENGSSF